MRRFFTMFFGIILFLSFSLNFYVLWRLFGFFKIKKGVIFWIAFFICSISLIGSSILYRYFDNIITKIIYVIATNWLGIMWLLFSTLIVYEVVKLFIKINPAAAGIGVLTIVGLLTIYSTINARLVRVKELVIRGNTNLKIVQLSDIHFGSTSENFLQRIIEKTNAFEPNIVVITGDLVDNCNEKTEKAMQRLKELKAETFFITGNHEIYAGAEKVIAALARANIKTLRNQIADFNEIQIIGIDETADLRDLGWIVKRLNRDESKFCLLLTHRPISPKALAEQKIELGLAGHLHHGQIYPFNYVVQSIYKFISGLYEENGSSIYITSGTGTWGPRMRLGSRSEIVLIRIQNTEFSRQ